uniref:non-specific serine/threonine protein kinase n=1 Tax=Chromera velia CCMP2878 TaxID=1169474 RepID=A0A0G4FL94_9ALVE|eukprot:Cvel_17440.t1-p1 / transcript=Cvel_17440.t1 / gene=Cvel_17440 / organism=Chromera_velia_CCMP2878 / gene_product=Serine/threonine-protein kinase sepA, putative / transcript_product=Serine/threonine-protein kinase sepA, putative / location=Cvel_scaffold1391:21931-42779(+) / protein_length=1410 / sequence_SO=supercontig / SO=protein_coding / is_pseudo=false
METAGTHREIPATLIGKWKLGDRIGKGAFGEVFKVMHVDTGEFAAVKRIELHNMTEDQLNNIMVEINLLKSLNHPNIVKYLESIRTEEHLNIILEYVEAGSVRAVLDKFGAFLEPLAAHYTFQVLEGLCYLHDQGVVHRDVKGANILTTKSGRCKLADFGVARNLGETEKAESVVGTPYWMAPEIITMDAMSTGCDVWSVGCTVIEMITRTPPYWDLPPMNALFRIVQDPLPPLPPGISVHLTDFLCRCFQKDTAMRSTAAQLMAHPWITGHVANASSVRSRQGRGEVAASRGGGEGESSAVFVEAARMSSDVDTDELDGNRSMVSGIQSEPGATAVVESESVWQGVGLHAERGGMVDEGGGARREGGGAPAGSTGMLGGQVVNTSGSVVIRGPPAYLQGFGPWERPSVDVEREREREREMEGQAGQLSGVGGRFEGGRNLGLEGDGEALQNGAVGDSGVHGANSLVAEREREREAAEGNGVNQRLRGMSVGEGGGLEKQGGSITPPRRRPEGMGSKGLQVVGSQGHSLGERGVGVSALGSASAAVSGGPGHSQQTAQTSERERERERVGVPVGVGVPVRMSDTPELFEIFREPPLLPGTFDEFVDDEGQEIDWTRRCRSNLPEFDETEEDPFLDVFANLVSSKRDRERQQKTGGTMGLGGHPWLSSAVPPAAASHQQNASPPGAGGILSTGSAILGGGPSSSHLFGGNAGPGRAAFDLTTVKKIMTSIRPFVSLEELREKCAEMTQLLQLCDERDLQETAQIGAVPFLELLLHLTERMPELVAAVLQSLNRLIVADEKFKANSALVGLIPAIIRFTRPQWNKAVKVEAARFVASICTAEFSLQMFVACGGIDALVNLLEHDYYSNRDLVYLAIDAIGKVFSIKTIPKNDFCRLFSKLGLCRNLAALLDTMASDIEEEAEVYLGKAVDLLLLLAQGDSVVKAYLVLKGTLDELLTSLEYLPAHVAVTMFRVLKHLCQEQTVFSSLENAGVIPLLVSFLVRCEPVQQSPRFAASLSPDSARGGGSGGNERGGHLLPNGHTDSEYGNNARPTTPLSVTSSPASPSPSPVPSLTKRPEREREREKSKESGAGGDDEQKDRERKRQREREKERERQEQDRLAPVAREVSSQCLQALFSICKISKPRQEQAVLAGIIPTLKGELDRNSKMKQFAIEMCFEFPHTSRAAREILFREGGIQILVRCLREPFWQAQALSALAYWLSLGTEQERVEAELFSRSRSGEEGRTGTALMRHVVTIFERSPNSTYQKAAQAVLDMVKASPEMSRQLCVNHDFMAALVKRIRTELMEAHHPKVTREHDGAVKRRSRKAPETHVRGISLRVLMNLCYSNQRHVHMLVKKHGLDSLLKSIAASDAKYVILAEIAKNLLHAFVAWGVVKDWQAGAAAGGARQRAQSL